MRECSVTMSGREMALASICLSQAASMNPGPVGASMACLASQLSQSEPDEQYIVVFSDREVALLVSGLLIVARMPNQPRDKAIAAQILAQQFNNLTPEQFKEV